MAIQGRKYTSSTGYRYGFNGKENDRETVGTGEGTQDYGLRIYNPSLGKFLSVDPLTKKFSDLTPYQFAANSTIWGIDLDGGELKIATIRNVYATKENGETLSNGQVVPVHDMNNSFYTVGQTIQPRSPNGTILEILNVNSQVLNRATNSEITLVAQIPLPIISSVPKTGTAFATSSQISSANITDGTAVVNLLNNVSSFASSGIIPGESVTNINFDFGNLDPTITAKQLKSFQNKLTSGISKMYPGVKATFNTSAVVAGSTSSGVNAIDYTSVVNTISTANLPNELSNLGYNAAFISNVMQTITSLLTGLPVPSNSSVTTSNVPNDSAPSK